MKNDSSKQDLSIAQQLPLHLSINPEKSKINLFIAESFKNLQIVEQTYNKSYGCRQDIVMKDLVELGVLETKRKVSDRSDSYHRVTNSRKIKTKRTTKDHLPRSEFFYFSSMLQPRQQNQIQKLLNDYQSFHSMIITNDFTPIQSTVIRLSHYGNKKKSSQSRQKSLSGTGIQHAQSFYHQAGFSYNKQEKKPLSRSAVVPQVDLKRSIVMGDRQDEKLLHEARNKQPLNSSKRQLHSHQRQALSKYTTPIRTIYLNKSQQSPQLINTHSSVNKLSVSTPLRNNKPYLQESGRNQGTGWQDNTGMISLRKSNNKRYANNSGQKSIPANCNNSNRPKLSIVSSQKKWTTPTQAQNVQVNKPNQVYLSKYQSDLKNLVQSSINLKPTLLHTAGSILHSNRQSHSRSNSRKGLSLTQSASQIVSKSKSQLICPKSIAKLNHNNSIQRQKQILARKLDQKGLLSSKRVQIRIY